MLASVACGPTSPADPPPPSAAAGTPQAAPITPAPTPVAPTPVAPVPHVSARDKALAHFDADTAKTQVAAFRQHLADGRKAVKAKDYAAGITAFEAALAIDANHPGTLGELGWAAYLSGDLTKAERWTQRAIAMATEDRTRGAVLYNLGRIHEDRGDRNEAALAYQRSLALRPNATVTQRLATLESGGATPEAHECDATLHAGSPPLDLCAAFVAKLAADPTYTENKCFDGETQPGEVAVDAAGQVAGGEPMTIISLDVGQGVKATSFGVERWLDSGGSETERYLAVLLGDRWFTLNLGTEYNPGVGYIGEDLAVTSIRAEDVVTGGRPELVVELRFSRHDGDYGDNVSDGSVVDSVGVISIDGDTPKWLGAWITAVVHDVGPMIDDEPSEAEVSRTETKVDYRLIAGTGEVEITAVAGVTPSTPPGRFVLGKLPAACPTGLPYVAGT